MTEHYTKAIVLGREPRNEFDETISLYTKKLGKISAISKSIRKITSKLSGHLVKGNLVDVRVLDNDSFQIIDALSDKVASSQEFFRLLGFIEKMTPYAEPDLSIWYELERACKTQNFGNSTYRKILQASGFDPEFAKCDNCGDNKIAYFNPPDIMFLCSECLNKSFINRNEVFAI